MTTDRAPSPTLDLPAAELLDAAPDAIIVAASDGTIALVNTQTEQLFGYARAELLGQPLELLVPQTLRSAHQHHVAGFFARPTSRAMGSGLALSGRRKDGVQIPVEVSLSPVHAPSGMLVCAAVRDVSERKRVEAAAKLSADRLASAVESIDDALALFDADDRLVLCNSAYRMLIGIAASGPLLGARYEDILGTWLPSLVFDSEDERERFAARRIAERSEPRTTFDVRTRDNRRLRVMNRRTLEGGQVQTIWDLSDDLRREEELREARATAEAASSAKSEFLSSMSHELRTPLNAILGFAQLLHRDRKEPLSDRHRERIEHILKGGSHLLRLIDEILDLSRIESGRVPMSPEPVATAEVLAEVETTLAAMAMHAGVQLIIEPVPPDLPNVIADRTRFAQILMNFGSNAIKYGRSTGQVVFRTLCSDAGVRVCVMDDGPGIPSDKQERIFQPFYRAGQETGAIEGTGIGLAICRRLAELMSGSVGFESTVGVGTEFWVELPIERTNMHPATTEERAPKFDTGSVLAFPDGPRYLVVYIEDNPSNIAFMEDLLGDFDRVELVTAPSAEIGIEIVRARRPQVVIMDINLPGMSGLEATRRLKDWPETRDIPVVALSAAATPRDVARADEIGFHAYLTKPVQVDKLAQTLEQLLASEHGGRSS